MLLRTHFWQVNSPARGGNDAALTWTGSRSPVVVSDGVMLPSVSLQYPSVWLQFDDFCGEQPSLSSTSSSGRFFWTSTGANTSGEADAKAATAPWRYRRHLYCIDLLMIVIIVFNTVPEMTWQKDEGDVQSPQVSAKANQISDKNSYCCNINPNFHQMQPWDIMWILLLWSITRSFCSHQQLVSGGASEERSICLLLNLAIFWGSFSGFYIIPT